MYSNHSNNNVYNLHKGKNRPFYVSMIIVPESIISHVDLWRISG